MNSGTQIRRSVLFFWPNPSIRRYFRSNPDPRYLTTFCCTVLQQQSVHVIFYDVFFLLRCFTYHYLFMESKKLYLKSDAIFFRLINGIHL